MPVRATSSKARRIKKRTKITYLDRGAPGCSKCRKRGCRACLKKKRAKERVNQAAARRALQQAAIEQATAEEAARADAELIESSEEEEEEYIGEIDCPHCTTPVEVNYTYGGDFECNNCGYTLSLGY